MSLRSSDCGPRPSQSLLNSSEFSAVLRSSDPGIKPSEDDIDFASWAGAMGTSSPPPCPLMFSCLVTDSVIGYKTDTALPTEPSSVLT